MVKIDESLKVLIIEATKKGKAVKDISETFDVNVNTVKTIINRWKKFKTFNRSRGHRLKKLPDCVVQQLTDWYDNNSQLKLDDAKDRIKEIHGIDVCVSTIYNYLKGLHYTIKKIHPVPVQRNDPDNIRTRYNYARTFLQFQDRDKVFFIDETGI